MRVNIFNTQILVDAIAYLIEAHQYGPFSVGANLFRITKAFS